MEENPNKDTSNSDPEPSDISPNPDEFYCPRCHTASLLSNNPLFCSKCGYAFPVGRNKEILVDQQNYAVFTNPIPPMPLTPISPLNHNPIGYNPPLTFPTPGYPVSYSQTYPQMGYSPIKQRTWNLLAGLLLPFIVYIIINLVGAIFVIISAFVTNNVFLLLLNFLVSGLSLFFLFAPILWMQRYFPGKLNFKQRLEIIGLSTKKYPKLGLVREIVLGLLLGLLMVLFVIVLQLFAALLVKWFYGVDIFNLLESLESDQFSLDTSMSFFELLLFILQMLLFVGFSEEVMFRGFVQRSFEKKLNKGAALLLTAIYFALFHVVPIAILYSLGSLILYGSFLVFPPPIFLFLTIPYIGISIILGLIRNWRQDLWAVGAAHVIYNCIQTIIIYFIFL